MTTARPIRQGTAAATALALAAALLVTTPGQSAGQVDESRARAPHCAGKRATIVGTRTKNRLVGTKHPDVIVGLRGNDRIIGRGGNDVICGGRGKDQALGGRGKDRIFGGRGIDRAFGGRGNDRLSDKPSGRHRAHGTVSRGADCGPGDRYYPGPGFDHVRTGYGFVDLSTGREPARIGRGVKHPSDDIRGADIIFGTRYDDRIKTPSATTVMGLGGSDNLVADRYLVDSWQASPGCTRGAKPVGKIGGRGDDVLHRHWYKGSWPGELSSYDGHDKLVGGKNTDRFEVDRGGERIIGRGGRDEIVAGGLGDDVDMKLGSGTIPYASPTTYDANVVEYTFLDGRGRVTGTSGRDKVKLRRKADLSVFAGGGDDATNARIAHGQGGDDRLTTIRPNAHVSGGKGSDTLIVAYGGADRARGRLSGGAGTDLLEADRFDHSIRVDLAAGTMLLKDPSGNRTRYALKAIEDVHGGWNRGDRFLGDSKDNRLIAHKAVVNGRGGTDTCEGRVVRNCER